MTAQTAAAARPRVRVDVATPTVGLVLEQTLGHITHAANLESILSGNPSIRTHWRKVAWEVDGAAARVPGYATNWTLRAGVRARRAIADLHQATPLDALFIHTQVPAVLAGSWLRRIPTVVSVDATPRQYDALGEFYAHATASGFVENLKWRVNRRCFAQAAHLVAWSHWAKADLVDGYEVASDRVTVVPPGVDIVTWRPPAPRAVDPNVVRLLFVGGDLGRKGGHLLIDAFSRVQREAAAAGVAVELDLVTSTEVAPRPGMTVHSGMTPNSPELKALYHRADVFCLPTRGDCLPMVLSEAGAAGLPLVSTDVGAIPEIVRDGETGLLVPPDDAAALTAALSRLVNDAGLRTRLGEGAAKLVERDFDAVANARRLVDVLTAVAEAGHVARGDDRTLLATPRRAPGERPVLLTVSGTIPADITAQVAEGVRPRPDYLVMADTFDADLLDHPGARLVTGRTGAVIERLVGSPAMLAWACFRLRRRYRVLVTDGEQVGLPYALFCRLARRRPHHIMIVHILSVAKKTLPFQLLRLARRIDTFIVYASAQRHFVEQRLRVAPDRVFLTPFMVDTSFFTPDDVESRPVIVSAGLEWRDYPTLVEAVRGLPVHVVVAAASPWSKREDTTEHVDLPGNVEVCKLGFLDLRRLYAASRFVVMPLHEVPFQAGVTTILEAMAMGKPVICSRTAGQTDVVVHGETGLYVPPGDAEALRKAIQHLLDHPDEVNRMGANGRRVAEERMDVVRYARRLNDVVQAAANPELEWSHR